MPSASLHKYAYIIAISAEDVDQLLHLGEKGESLCLKKLFAALFA
jgi:hypothetical protein